jgi:hypothetical protein
LVCTTTFFILKQSLGSTYFDAPFDENYCVGFDWVSRSAYVNLAPEKRIHDADTENSNDGQPVNNTQSIGAVTATTKAVNGPAPTEIYEFSLLS